MTVAAPPTPQTDRLPALLLHLLLQLLPPLRQAVAAGAAKAAAATSELSGMTGRQMVAHQNKNFMRQVSQRHSWTTTLHYKQRPQQLQGHTVHQRPRLLDAAVRRNMSRDGQRA